MTRFLLVALLAGGAYAQPAFEAATVKAADAGGGRASTFGDRLTLNRTTLSNALVRAFGLSFFNQVSGPAWIFSERYDIVAKAPDHTPPDQFPRMLQTLLIERFNLKLHHETRDLAAYALTLGKSPLKLEEVKDPRSKNDWSLDGEHRSARGMTMAVFSIYLSQMLQSPVLDRTALPGYYNFPLDPTLEETRRDSDPSVFTAVSTLGLHLDSVKAPFDVIVIESGNPVPADN